MRINRLFLATLSVASVALGFFALHCGASDANCGDTLTCATAVDAGADVVQVPNGCELDKAPKDSLSCIDESVAIFVNPNSGLDTNPGSKSNPVKSIGAALNNAGARPRVYLCDGSYVERVTITRGIAIYGGFDCSTWNPNDTKPTVAPADPGYAIEIKAGKSPVLLANLRIQALPGTAALKSSITLFAQNSLVSVQNSEVVASDGASGTDGSTTSNYVTVPINDPKIAGISSDGGTGAGSQECIGLCTGSAHATGGAGGNGLPQATGGQPGKPDRGAGLGGPAGGCTAANYKGNPAPAADDAAAVGVVGTLSAEGWKAADGLPGKLGEPGQGGGGGGGATDVSAGGGGGGCGGCGGGPGNAGTAGGSSIAVLLFQTTFTAADSTFTTGRGGDGGKGTTGQEGQQGGVGGNGYPGACQGGRGGDGGRGGASGGGAGGVSIGVVYKGEKPTLNITTVTGTGGAKGAGGTAANDGVPGQKGDTLEVQ